MIPPHAPAETHLSVSPSFIGLVGDVTDGALGYTHRSVEETLREPDKDSCAKVLRCAKEHHGDCIAEQRNGQHKPSSALIRDACPHQRSQKLRKEETRTDDTCPKANIAFTTNTKVFNHEEEEGTSYTGGAELAEADKTEDDEGQCGNRCRVWI